MLAKFKILCYNTDMKNVISAESIYSMGNWSKWLVPTLYYTHTYNSFDMIFHRHPRMELMYVVSGEMHVEFYNGDDVVENLTVLPNNYVFIDANVLHKIYVDKVQTKIFNLEFVLDSDTVFNFSLNSVRVKSTHVNEFLQSGQPVVSLYDTGSFFQILNNIQKYLSDNNNPNTYQDMHVNFLLGAMFTLFCMQFTENKLKFGVGIKHVNIALQFIAKTFNQDISLTSLAKECNLSPNYLNNLFVQSLGITVKNYINQYRIKRAMQLLANTDSPIADIIQQVGYNSKASFHQNFQKFAGVSPMKYRQQSGDNNSVQIVNNYNRPILYQ